MAVQAGLQVVGGRELRRTAKKAGVDIQDLKEAHAAAAGIVTPVARARVTVLTGRAASTVRPGATKTQSVIRGGKKSVPYLGVLEFGWPARNIAAQPAIVPAAHDTEPQWTALFAAAVDKIIDQIKGA